LADNFDQQMLKSVLDYDPETGLFRWKTERSNRPNGGRIGTVAGCPASNGYWRIWLFGEERLGHRLAWLWMTGEWPASDIDHDNLNRADNKWLNLRLANPSLNAGNILPKKTKGWPFVKGVTFVKKQPNRPFKAGIEFEGKSYYLGSHPTLEEAAEAYAVKARELFGDFARVA
jgi:HNH endonuclease